MASTFQTLVVLGSNNSTTAWNFDGNIDANGNPFHGDDRAVTVDAGWGIVELAGTMNPRVGANATVAPVAVYVTWDPALASLSGGTQWASDAWYEVFLNGTLLGTTQVNQQYACSAHDSPVPNDRPWLLLGVWNVPIGDESMLAWTTATTSPATGSAQGTRCSSNSGPP